MSRRSAGILLWRRTADGALQVLLGHMGGPYWAGKDAGAWSVVKGEHDEGEPALAAAVREFREELGLPLPVPVDRLVGLGEVRQSGGKRVEVWAGEADLDPEAITPGTFALEWPPRSGRSVEFPEVDTVAWFGVEEAARRIVNGQRPFLDRLQDLVAERRRP